MTDGKDGGHVDEERSNSITGNLLKNTAVNKVQFRVNIHSYLSCPLTMYFSFCFCVFSPNLYDASENITSLKEAYLCSWYKLVG